MPIELAQLLIDTLEREMPNLRSISEEAATVPRGEGKWCPKEEIGHLLDSAANNHIRFVRATLDGEFRGPSYVAEDWVRLHGYRDLPWDAIVTLWHGYNSLLGKLIRGIPEHRLQSPCLIGSSEPLPLSFVIEDYVLHMQHHLDLLFRRPVITAYGIKPSE